ncbi:monovalent cation/H+ antiporter complex subunit F [Nocardioides caldifontis]|uniref:monovalent cation/H+ antiporter complex subunit F n=1 Tax=Nocardioides caldifontis TaxID=2588938 RepID=UPI0011DF602D|nr:monovalent cation/H+ antiporter complex subunit F [Nocardioides caldifontis]
MTWVLGICSAFLVVAAVLVVVRITRGPTMLDRIVAFDVLVSATICALGLEAAVHQHTHSLPILAALALLGFVSTASVASLTGGRQGVEEEDR